MIKKIKLVNRGRVEEKLGDLDYENIVEGKEDVLIFVKEIKNYLKK